ncbi:MAG: TonB-dependent receptor [Methylophilaceae bacterium]
MAGMAMLAASLSSVGAGVNTDIRLDEIVVRDKKPTFIGPNKGLMLRMEQIPANVQSVTAKELRETQSLSIADYMNNYMQGVTVNEYQGNPFQMDVQFRGFTASPQVGTPQGISVFLDGIRMNEPFGDVVNWDMIPMNALAGFDIFPGSNPLFGLNTLGGAIALRTKSGFSEPGVNASYTMGSWGREHKQLSGGGSKGVLGGFVAINSFKEDGWRDNSPTSVQQLFGKTEIQTEKFSAGLSVLKINNGLVGNGLIPVEIYEQRPESVYSSPDKTSNELTQLQLSGEWFATETFNITGMVYKRDSNRSTYNGDVYNDFEEMDKTHTNSAFARTGLSPCQVPDANGDGVPDGPALNAPCGDPWTSLGGTDARNGGANGTVTPGGVQVGGTPGVIAGTPNAQIGMTDLFQKGKGTSIQFNWDYPNNKLMVGASIDSSEMGYDNRQRLGLLDASRNAIIDPANIDYEYYAARNDVPINQFDGKSSTRSAFFSNTWSPWKTLHLSLAGRLNVTKAKTNLKSRAFQGSDNGNLHDIRERENVNIAQVLCPTPDPSTCPVTSLYDEIDPSQFYLNPTSDQFHYRSFNPSVGLSWEATPALNVFGNASRGTRTPSVIELGCAYQPPSLDIRLRGGGQCTLPNVLGADPFLPQIEAQSMEVGLRGTWGSNWRWNASLYQTDIKDDLYFITTNSGGGNFDNIGPTRRRGLEAGFSGKVGKTSLRFNYSLTDATFQSDFYMTSPFNSSTDLDDNHLASNGFTDNRGRSLRGKVLVEAGDTMPGMSLHNFNATLGYDITEKWSVQLTGVAHSMFYLRGNENNEHSENAEQIRTLRDSPIIQAVCVETDPLDPSICTRTENRTVGYVPGAKVRLPNARGKGQLPFYAVFHLQTSYIIGKGFTLSAKVNNLFDNEYASAGRLGVNPFSPSINGAIGSSGFNYNSNDWLKTDFIGPGGPRALWVTLRYDFSPSNK